MEACRLYGLRQLWALPPLVPSIGRLSHLLTHRKYAQPTLRYSVRSSAPVCLPFSTQRILDRIHGNKGGSRIANSQLGSDLGVALGEERQHAQRSQGDPRSRPSPAMDAQARPRRQRTARRLFYPGSPTRRDYRAAAWDRAQRLGTRPAPTVIACSLSPSPLRTVNIRGGAVIPLAVCPVTTRLDENPLCKL